MQERFGELIQHLREDVDKVDEPQLKASQAVRAYKEQRLVCRVAGGRDHAERHARVRGDRAARAVRAASGQGKGPG
jgi:hypothetical protein